jgi:hypothetical protein
VQLFNEDVKMFMMICEAANHLVNEDLLRAVKVKILEHKFFIITSLSLHFLKFHGHFTKLCAHSVLKMLTEERKLKQQASRLDFLI